MNSDLALDSVRELASGIAKETEADVSVRLNDLYLRLFGRPARENEIQLLATELGRAENDEDSLHTSQDWERICRVLIAANEFVYVN